MPLVKQTRKASYIILQYCKAIRFALQDDGCYPLEPGGLKLYCRLRAIQQSLQLDNRVHPNIELDKLIRKLSILDELKLRCRRIKRLYALIFEANHILEQEAKSEKVQADTLLFFEKLTKLRFKRREDRAAVCNVLRFAASYWEGLFYHYDHADVPRTNNDLERFIRKLKVNHRKTTGRSSCQGYVIRYGAYVALLDESMCQQELLFRLRIVDYEVFRQCYCEIRSFRRRLSFKRCLSDDFKGFLCALEQEWAKIVV